MASTINSAISAVVTLLEAQGALSDFTVHDGPPTTSETPDWISVGYQPGEAESVVVTYEFRAIGQRSQEERYDILCALMTSSGDADMSARRTRALELRDVVASALATDYSLGGLVRIAHLSSATLLQDQGKGALAGFTFTVSVQARITS